MSEEQYNESEHEHEHEHEPQHEAPPLVRIEVQFNGDGKAIGPNAAKYASRLGKLTRQHCPPQYSEWTLVPEEAIDFLWKGILSWFDVPVEYRSQQPHKANNLWRNWKTTLRKHCDKYDTVLERKRNRKSGVKKEEWDLFVDMESTEHAYLRHERGKENRKTMNNPHTTDRRGSARTVEEMVVNDPANPPSRTDIFVVTHTRKNGTFVSEEVRQKMINEIVARDPSSKYKDLDHDPVAEVFGKDGRGQVLGLGSGVSKTTLMVAAPYKKKAEEAERSKLELQSQIDDLKQQVIDGKKTQMEMQSQVNALLTMQGINPGAQMRISTNSPSDQTTDHSLSRRPMVSHSGQTCELQSMGGRVVAIGRMLGDREDAHENAYRIIVGRDLGI
ncbi:hypothetical protein IFM89_016321 [Coptis chinensis]|uniref:Transposase n=1 Tax=Coptis chinensis TaxID=261450 RepID=A0A835HDM6_9MAGN|nr:hypothetical protein IFM89_016321 [Coptis chinensis]